MNGEKNTPRLLGAMFLVVVVTSLAGGLLLASVTGGAFASASISTILVDIADRVALVRASIVADLATSVGEIALAALLYVVLRNQSRVVALVALGCWLGEALSLALSKVGVVALISLSQEYIRAGAPTNSFYQTLGDFLYTGITMRLGATTQMFFYCVGGLLWYGLFFRSRYIPRVIPLFGLAAVSVALVGVLLEFLGFSVSSYVYLPILPFELIIGGWLLLRGITADELPREAATRSRAVPGRC